MSKQKNTSISSHPPIAPQFWFQAPRADWLSVSDADGSQKIENLGEVKEQESFVTYTSSSAG